MKKLRILLALSFIGALPFMGVSSDPNAPNPTCDNEAGTLVGGKCVTAGTCLYGFDYPDGGCYRIGQGTGNCYYHFTCVVN